MLPARTMKRCAATRAVAADAYAAKITRHHLPAPSDVACAAESEQRQRCTPDSPPTNRPYRPPFDTCSPATTSQRDIFASSHHDVHARRCRACRCLMRSSPRRRPCCHDAPVARPRLARRRRTQPPKDASPSCLMLATFRLSICCWRCKKRCAERRGGRRCSMPHAELRSEQSAAAHDTRHERPRLPHQTTKPMPRQRRTRRKVPQRCRAVCAHCAKRYDARAHTRIRYATAAFSLFTLFAIRYDNADTNACRTPPVR